MKNAQHVPFPELVLKACLAGLLVVSAVWVGISNKSLKNSILVILVKQPVLVQEVHMRAQIITLGHVGSGLCTEACSSKVK